MSTSCAPGAPPTTAGAPMQSVWRKSTFDLVHQAAAFEAIWARQGSLLVTLRNIMGRQASSAQGGEHLQNNSCMVGPAWCVSHAVSEPAKIRLLSAPRSPALKAHDASRGGRCSGASLPRIQLLCSAPLQRTECHMHRWQRHLAGNVHGLQVLSWSFRLVGPTPYEYAHKTLVTFLQMGGAEPQPAAGGRGA